MLGTYHDDDIRQIGDATWYVHSGPFYGTSNSNSMNNDVLITGTEATTQNEATACNGQSGVGYYASLDNARNKTLTSDWPGANDPYDGEIEYGNPIFFPGRPPWVAFIGPGHWHDWAGPLTQSEEQSLCYGSNAADVPSTALVRRLHGNRSTTRRSRRLHDRHAALTSPDIGSAARAFAASFGDSSPTSIEHVEAPRNEAVFATSNDVIPDSRETFLVVERGSFVDHNRAFRLPGGSPLSGSVLTLVIDASSGQVTDFGIQDNVPDLSGLGPITVDQ